jgi:uncharacterized repeat protein (TIGR02543 family)
VILDATTNGGSVTPASLTFTVGGAALVLPTPNAPAGYSFSNWFTSSTGGTVVASPYTPTANVTIFAQFTPNNYVLTYKLDGGSWFGGGTSDTVYGSVPFGTDVLNASLGYRPLPDPTRAGFNFGGWNTAQGVGAGLGTQTLGSSDLTLWAQWTSTVTFDATTNGGTAVSPSSVIYIAGATGITLPTPASRSGYSFNGWYTAASGGSLAPNPYVPSNPSTTLFAQWSPILPKLTVNLNSLSTFNSGTATYQFAMVDAIGLVRTTFIDTVPTLTPLVSGSFTSPQAFTGIQIDPTKFLSTAGGRSTAGPFNFSLWLSVSNSFTSPYTITINSGNASLVDSFNASWVNSGDVWVYLFTMSSDSIITIS